MSVPNVDYPSDAEAASSSLERIRLLLADCATDRAVMPPTELYNEGWMLRLVLDWFDTHRGIDHALAFSEGARWYSEGLLASEFLARVRGDPCAEGYTHADGVVGHFDVSPGSRSEVVLTSDTRQLTVVEAKLGSALSSGTKNAPGYDQAARNVACLIHMIHTAGLDAEGIRCGFYVVAPASQLDAGVFGDLVTPSSITKKVRRRVAQYEGEKDAWYHEIFEGLLAKVDLGVVTWESILEFMARNGAGSDYAEFYKRCREFNGLMR